MQKWICPKSTTSLRIAEAQAGDRYLSHVHEYHANICGLLYSFHSFCRWSWTEAHFRSNSAPQAQALANPQEALRFHAAEKSTKAMDQLWRSLTWSPQETQPLNMGSYTLQENIDCIFCSWKWQVLEKVLKKNPKPNGTDTCCVAIPTEWRYPGALVLSREHLGTRPIVHSSWSKYKVRCPNKLWEPKNSIEFGSQHSEEICFLSHQFPAFFGRAIARFLHCPVHVFL